MVSSVLKLIPTICHVMLLISHTGCTRAHRVLHIECCGRSHTARLLTGCPGGAFSRQALFACGLRSLHGGRIATHQLELFGSVGLVSWSVLANHFVEVQDVTQHLRVLSLIFGTIHILVATWLLAQQIGRILGGPFIFALEFGNEVLPVVARRTHAHFARG